MDVADAPPEKIKPKYCGVAEIKEEFLIRNSTKFVEKSKILEESVAEKEETETKNDSDEPAKKKARFRGQNKKRPRDERIAAESRLCVATLNDTLCRFGDKCRFSHDIQSYWKSKPEDLPGDCPNFTNYGKCKHGLSCRFAKSHVDSNLKNVISFDKVEESSKLGPSETNTLTDDLRKLLLKKTYDYGKSEKYLKTIAGGDKVGCVVENGKNEPKKLLKNWAGKLYLAPLTTVGNLPFRRVCVDYGADITCGEMAMATELLQV